jgi:translocator protein
MHAPAHRQEPARAGFASLIGWLVVVFVAAGLGAIGSRDAPLVYGQLALPPWAPPAGVFGPVWTVLYALMAVAAWLVWRSPQRSNAAIGLFMAQLVANVLWSWCFFAWRSGALAAIDIIVLLGLILATTVAFWRVRPLAGVLLLPYLAWVAFATALTFAVWQRNPAAL